MTNTVEQGISPNRYICEKGLKALDNYKYTSSDGTWLDAKLGVFWTWATTLVPLWVAPNLITLLGFLHLLLTVVITLIYDPQLKGESPSWAYFVIAWCLFAYQTMDAMDGKQARRTKSSSPLGQLFDHGCDSLGLSFIAIALCSILGFGNSWKTYAMLSVTQLTFYTCQWEENFAHILRANVGYFGVTEGQLAFAVTSIQSGLFGVGIWHNTLRDLLLWLNLNTSSLPDYLLDEHMNILTIPLITVCPSILACVSLKTVYRKSRGSFLDALKCLLPIFVQQLLQVSLRMISPGKEIVENNLVPVLLLMGFLHSYLCDRVIISTVCGFRSAAYYWILAPAPFLIVGNVAVNMLSENEALFLPLSRIFSFSILAYSVCVMMEFFYFVTSVINAITNHLGIHCFSLKKQKKG